MPRRRSHSRLFLLLLAVFLSSCAAFGQDAKKPSAIKLPDGTIVFYTANPNDAAPKIDGVVLSAKEYQQLLDLGEQLKKVRESAKPVSPSVCRVRGRVDATAGKPIAKLTVEYSFRTAAPRSLVLLGGQRAAPVSAMGADGKVPLLELTADGLAVLVEQPGEGKVTLELETALSARGSKNELGFELGLPKAAITSLVFESPGPTIKKLTVGTRTPEPGAARPAETKRTTDDAVRYAAKPGGTGVPLGPIDLLEVAWESPAAPGSGDTGLTVDAEIAVRVDESQIETTARLRLRGPAREWMLALPKDATLTVSRPNATATEAATMAVRPTDPKQPLWKVATPEAGEWIVTAVARVARPDPKDAKFPGPYPIPVAFVSGIPRQSGTLRVFAPPTIRISNYRHPAEVRRLDSIAGADAPVASFKYATAAPTPPAFDFEARPARGFTAVQPHHKLDLTHEGWRLRTELRVAPVRSTIEQLTFELPVGWRDPIVRPDDRVDEVQSGPEANGKRPWTVRLANGMAEPFALTVETLFAVPETANEASLVLPRFPGVTERETQVSVSVAEGLAVRSTARDATGATALAPVGTTKPAAAAQLTGAFETSIASLDLAWQPYRAELLAAMRVEVTLGERQMSILQTVQFKANDPIGRTIRFKGPPNPLALQSTPALEPSGTGQWSLAVPADAKDARVVLGYSMPLPPRGEAKPGPVDVPLIWPDATSVSVTTRIWGTPAPGARRPTSVQGPWEERPPEPAAERDSLPWLTLAATGSTKGVPLAFDLAEPLETGGTVVERAAYQSWAAPDGTVLARARFLLKRWSPAGLDLELAGAGAPTIFVNRERVDGPVAGPESERSYRVPLPESKPNRTALVIEVQYSLPPGPRGDYQFVPPRIRGATLLAPARCQVALSSGSVPLVFGPSFVPDHRWGWRGGFPAPVAGLASDEMERWFFEGATPPEADPWNVPSDDAVTGRLFAVETLRVVRVPRVPFIVGCSLLALLLGFGIARLRPRLVGPAIALLGLSAIAAGTFVPQPAVQFLAASLPGLAALAVALGFGAAVRWIARRRIDYLPTFRRGAVPPPPSGTASNPRPSRNGTASAESAKTAPPLLSSQAPG